MTAIFTAFDTALFTALTGNTSLNALVGGRIYDTQAPEATGGLSAEKMYPMVIFQQISGGDQNDSPLREIDPTYRVECIALDRATAAQGQGYIDTALHNQTLTISGMTNWATTAQALFNMIENFQGRQYFRKGAFYKIRAQG